MKNTKPTVNYYKLRKIENNYIYFSNTLNTILNILDVFVIGLKIMFLKL